MSIDESVAWLPISELGSRLRTGSYSCVDLTAFFLDRLRRFGPVYNAVVHLDEDRAKQDAAERDKELQSGHDRGPLHGIPFGVKDLLATKDLPTSWGAEPFRDQVIDTDATVVTRLRDSGAVLLAKLAMVEMAGGLGYERADASFTGPGLNPWDPSRWAGGSSSGSGSAVSAGLVPFAIGSETWGSITCPAAYCGVSGMRPTYGRVSRHGAMVLSWTMDKLGPMGRTAADCGVVLAAVAGADPNDESTVDREFRFTAAAAPYRPFRFAAIEGAGSHVQDEVATNYRRSLDVLHDLGTVETIELPDLPYNTVAATLVAAEMSAAYEHLAISGECWRMTAEEDHWGIYPAMTIPAKDYINAMRIRVRIQRVMDELLREFDAIVTPTRSTVAYPLDGWNEYRQGFRNTSVGAAGNAAGLPSISVPNGFGESGLPTGLEFTGRAFEETRVLEAAAAYQSLTDWHTRHPEVVRVGPDRQDD